MVNTENLQMHPIESPRQMLVKDFEKIKGNLSHGPLVYEDSKGEKILIAQRGKTDIGIYKAEDPNEFISVAPGFQNIKSSYVLKKSDKGYFSLETKTYTSGFGKFSHEKSRNYIFDLNLSQVNDSLKTFKTRINEAKVFEQNEKNKNYKKMQQYAYNQEVQDKNDADNLINNLDNLDDSLLA